MIQSYLLFWLVVMPVLQMLLYSCFLGVTVWNVIVCVLVKKDFRVSYRVYILAVWDLTLTWPKWSDDFSSEKGRMMMSQDFQVQVAITWHRHDVVRYKHDGIKYQLIRTNSTLLFHITHSISNQVQKVRVDILACINYQENTLTSVSLPSCMLWNQSMYCNSLGHGVVFLFSLMPAHRILILGLYNFHCIYLPYTVSLRLLCPPPS